MKHESFYILDRGKIIFESYNMPEKVVKSNFGEYYLTFVKNGNYEVKKAKRYFEQKNCILKAVGFSKEYPGDQVVVAKSTGFMRNGKDILKAEGLFINQPNKDQLIERITKAFKNYTRIFKIKQNQAIDRREKEVAKFFERLRKLVIKNMRKIDELKVFKDADELKISREEIKKTIIDDAFKGYEDELDKYTDSILKSGLRETEVFGNLGYRHITGSDMPKEIKEDMLKFAEKEILKTSGKDSLKVFETSRKIIEKSISDSLIAQKSFTDIIDEVQDKFDNMSTLKARTVATTEMGDITNFTALEGAVKGGATHKQFIWSGVERESHAAIDGNIVKIDDPWITGDGNVMYWPNAASLPPEERISCTCSLAPLSLTAEEAEAMGVEKSSMVRCKNCKNEVDYKKEPEICMGAIKCPTCKTVINQLGNIFKVSEYGEDYFKSLEPLKNDFIIEFAEIAKYLSGSVLEIGCGTGKALGILNNSGFFTKGVDISETALSICNDKGIDIDIMDASDLSFADRSFDCVFSIHTLEHVKNVKRAISESVRVARDLVLHAVPLGERGDPTHRHEFLTLDSLKKIFESVKYIKSFKRIGSVAIVMINKGLVVKNDLFSKLDDMVLVPDYISLVGSSVNKEDSKDLDYVYRENEYNQSVELLMRNQVGEKLEDKLHPIANAQGPHGDYVPLYDLVARRKDLFKVVQIQKQAFKPLTTFTPAKTGFTHLFIDFKNLDPLHEDWAKEFIDKKIPIFVEEKFNGWRTILETDKGNTLMFFEDSKKDRTKNFPDLIDELKLIKQGVILDLDLGAIGADGRRMARKDLADFGTGKKTIEREFKTTAGLEGSLIANVFDILWFDGEDLRDKPFKERRKILEKLFNQFDFKIMRISESKSTDSKDKLFSEIIKVSKSPASEGAVIKAADSQYTFKPISGWAKVKNTVKANVRVKNRIPVKGLPDTFNYEIQYIGQDDKLKDMGKTFNTKVKASEGDVITITFSEAIPVVKDKEISVSVVAPGVVEKTDSKPDTVDTIIKNAWEGNILQTNPNTIKELRSLRIIKQEQRVGKLEFKEGDEGEGVLQSHELGLTEDQTKFTTVFGLKPVELTDKDIKILNTIKKADWKNLGKKKTEQLKKIFSGIKLDDLDSEQRRVFAKADPVSVHTDFRLQKLSPKEDDFWMGGEGFTPGNQHKKNLFKVITDDPEKFKERILSNFKVGRKGEKDTELSIKGPLAWMTIGDKEPVIFKPGEVGATSKSFARMKIIDKFKWRAGVQDDKFKEFEFDGDLLKGRWIFTLTPLDIGDMWLIGRPKDQELKADKPKKIKREIPIIKVDKKKSTIYCLVYEPDVADAHGDWATKEDIEKACNDFMIDILANGYTGLNFMHKDPISKDDAIIIQNWTQKEDGKIGEQKAIEGSWWIGIKIFNKNLLKLIEEKKITGLSMEGTAHA